MAIPNMEMAKSKPVLFRNIFTKEAIIIPIRPMKRNDPIDVRSFLVVYPYKLMAPNVPAVIRNTRAKLVPVYIKTMGVRDMPMMAA